MRRREGGVQQHPRFAEFDHKRRVTDRREAGSMAERAGTRKANCIGSVAGAPLVRRRLPGLTGCPSMGCRRGGGPSQRVPRPLRPGPSKRGRDRRGPLGIQRRRRSGSGRSHPGTGHSLRPYGLIAITLCLPRAYARGLLAAAPSAADPLCSAVVQGVGSQRCSGAAPARPQPFGLIQTPLAFTTKVPPSSRWATVPTT